jgi:hypothetical protein
MVVDVAVELLPAMFLDHLHIVCLPNNEENTLVTNQLNKRS